MFEIFQIIIGKIPDHLRTCIDSVKNYSNVKNYSYYSITQHDFIEPEFKDNSEKFMWRRHVSDNIRLKILSEKPYSLYVDWDIFLYPDFNIENKEKFCFGDFFSKDALIYNGNDCAVFKEIKQKIKIPSVKNDHNLRALLNKVIPKQRFIGHYVNFDNCRFENTFDLI